MFLFNVKFFVLVQVKWIYKVGVMSECGFQVNDVRFVIYIFVDMIVGIFICCVIDVCIVFGDYVLVVQGYVVVECCVDFVVVVEVLENSSFSIFKCSMG